MKFSIRFQIFLSAGPDGMEPVFLKKGGSFKSLE